MDFKLRQTVRRLKVPHLDHIRRRGSIVYLQRNIFNIIATISTARFDNYLGMNYHVKMDNYRKI